MKSLGLPLRYLCAIMSPKKLFQLRRLFKWQEIVMLIIILNACLFLPTIYSEIQVEDYSLDRIVEGGLVMINEQTASALKQGEIRNNHYTGQHMAKSSQEGKILVLPNQDSIEQINQEETPSLILTGDQWIFHYGPDKSITFPVYGENIECTKWTSDDEVKKFVNQQWFLSNKKTVILYLLMVAMALFIGNSLFLVILGGFFLSLVKKSKLFHIRGFKEGVSLMVGCLGLPTLLAAASGFIFKSPILMLNVQMIGTILMVVLVFYKTQFRDPLIEEN